ncbi:synaptogenesis protein syg-2 isoform X2 [Octopus sinensis]|uniref:Synaptogenesis protein syg-2 isoform X2 n=1 Tax=Octopus sinensis TaxID=2607531 RepID=A0A6P7T7R4_9MOLL|nr:synaptogenesis protein syg-2 isoform X2 [Octopus sinensis]
MYECTSVFRVCCCCCCCCCMLSVHLNLPAMRRIQTLVIITSTNIILFHTLWITFGVLLQPISASLTTTDDHRCPIIEPRPDFKIPTCSAGLSSTSIGCWRKGWVVVMSITSGVRRTFVKGCLKYLKKMCHKANPCILQLRSPACNRLAPHISEYSIEYACVDATPPGKPVIEGFNPEIPLLENERLLVSCNWSGGFPSALVRLSCGATISIGVSVTMLAIDVKRDLNDFQCICEGLHPGISKNTSQSMTVYYPPATPKVFPSTVFPWFENQTEQIICRSDPEGNPPPTTYEWFPTEGSSMQDTNSDADGHLTFHQVNRKHNLQEFYCVATNQFTQMTEKLVKSKEITVHVTYPPIGRPEMKVIGPNESLYGNETLTVVCAWKGGNPEANLQLTCGSLNYMGVSEVSVLLEFSKHLNISSCTCNGTHPLKQIVNTRNVSFNYIPRGNILIEGFETDRPETENTTLTVACSWIGSQPAPRVQLTCGGVNSSGKQACALFFFLTRHLHGTDCVCTAMFHKWKKTVTKQLNIYYTPGSPKITSQSSLPWIAGDVQTLTCHARPGNPPDTQYKWLSESGYLIHKGETLTFDPVTRMEHRMTVICQAENKLSHTVIGRPKTASVRLEVKYPPGQPMISSSHDFPWLEGSDQSLYCEAKPGNPPYVFYKWFSANRGLIHTGSVLRFHPVSRSNHSDRLACRAENTFTVMQHGKHITQSVIVLVEYRPAIELTENSTVSESQDITLQCSAEGNPSPQVSLQFGEVLQNDSHTFENSPMFLELKNISRNQAGQYTCTAKSESHVYGALISEKSMNLVVQYSPDVQVVTPPNATEGTQVNLTCVADGEPNRYTYRWQHKWGEIILQEFDNVETSSEPAVLTLENVTFEDGGTYRCLVENGIPDRNGNIMKSGSAEFIIQAKPVFEIDAISNVSIEYGGNLSISVSFYSFPVYSEMTWSFDDTITSEPDISTEIQPTIVLLSTYGREVTAEGHAVIFTITDLRETEIRTLNLNISNSVGTGSHQITIIPAGPPLEPMDFTVVNITHTSITVKWTPAFNGGYEQLFYLSHRPISYDGEWIETIHADQGNGNDIFVTINNLKRGAKYAFSLHTENTRPGERNRSQTLKFTTKTEEIQTVRISPSSITTGTALGFIIGGMIAAALVITACFLIGRIACRGSNRNDTKTSTTATQAQCQSFELASVNNATTTTMTTSAGASGCEEPGSPDLRLTPLIAENGNADIEIPHMTPKQNLNEDEL